ncbi:MAG: hypothetical protein U0746_14845 [Gemmataceae bacterium]
MTDLAARPSPLVTAIVLFALAGTMASLRLRTYDEPVEFDIALYAVVGHEMHEGRKLYSEIWDQKPPAIHTTYMLAESLLGYGPRAVYGLNVLASTWTLFAVFAAGSAFPPGRSSGLWAATLWALISDNLILQANQPNSEVFMNALTATAFALWVRAPRGPGFVCTLVIGALVCLASMYKQVILAPAVLWAVADVAFPPAESSRVRRLLTAISVFAVVAVGWVALGYHFYADGRWDDFYGTVVLYNKAYAGSPLKNLLFAIRPYRFLGDLPSAAPLMGMLAVAGASIALVWRAAPARPWRLLAAYGVGAWAAAQAPGKGFPHYFQLLLPPLVIAAGATIGLLREMFATYSPQLRPWLASAARVVPLFAGLAVVGQQVYFDYHNYRRPAHEWARRKYGTFYHRVEELGHTIGTLLEPDETLFVFADLRPGLYYYSQRRPAAGVLFTDPLIRGPLVERMTDRTLDQLRATPPELVVIALNDPLDERAEYADRPTPLDPKTNRVSEWLLERYKCRPELDVAGMEVYTLRNGRLAERLAAKEGR